ncbi:MAG: hypothetical protein RSA29_06505 [Clostridium sp.]|uniref:hypothetical protein n=1 Tax=Clostridium sp. TaxID=1506 RepID=UPI00306323D5
MIKLEGVSISIKSYLLLLSIFIIQIILKIEMRIYVYEGDKKWGQLSRKREECIREIKGYLIGNVLKDYNEL